MAAALEFLGRACAPDGRYRLPLPDESGMPAARGYDLALHAALLETACALCLALHDRGGREAAGRAGDFLVRTTIAAVPGAPATARAAWAHPAVTRGGRHTRARTADSASACAALVSAAGLGLAAARPEVLAGLGDFLLHAQRPGGGFAERGDVCATPAQAAPATVAAEASRALVMLHTWRADDRWMEAAARALQWWLDESDASRDSDELLARWLPVVSALGQAGAATEHALRAAGRRVDARRQQLLTRGSPLAGVLCEDPRCVPVAATVQLLADGPGSDPRCLQAVAQACEALAAAQLRHGPAAGAVPRSVLEVPVVLDPAAGRSNARARQLSLEVLPPVAQAWLAGRRALHPAAGRPLPRWRPVTLAAADVDVSAELAYGYICASQRDDGAFAYELDWSRDELVPGDNPVRQAGTLWAVALTSLYRPALGSGPTWHRALKCFENCAKEGPEGTAFIAWPGDERGALGTVSLVALALVDAQRAGIDSHPDLAEALLRHLLAARREDGHWHGACSLDDGTPAGVPSPYFDGESLLTLARAARFQGRDELRATVLASAEAGYRDYVAALWGDREQVKRARGYVQWGAMAYHELAMSGWPESGLYRDRVFEIADWLVDRHRLLTVRGNAGYAFEGLVPAWRLADLGGERLRAARYARVIDLGLRALMSYQIGHPMAPARLRDPSIPARARGGCHADLRRPLLRIDVTQHQLHAMLLASCYLYEGEAAATGVET